MNDRPQFEAEDLRRRLLDRLFEGLAGLRDPRPAGTHPHGKGLFTYGAIRRERIAAITLAHPLIGVVLRGRKEVWFGGDLAERLLPGMVFALPAGVPLDVVNVPCERAGLYESLIFEITKLPAPVAALPQPAATAWTGPDVRLTLTADLVEAVAHAATAIADGPARARVGELRLAEMLTLLAGDAAARHLFARRLSDDLALRMAARPDEDWSVGRAAAALGLGGSTLRRRLACEGTGFRAILTRVRMEAARRLLSTGAASGDAALASGYASRSHFARRYRAAFGTLPGGGADGGGAFAGTRGKDRTARDAAGSGWGAPDA